MLENKTRAWIEIDLVRMKHNVEEIKKLIPATSKIMAIVKANAYGHGDLVSATLLEQCGVDFFGVSSVDEALNLRDVGVKSKILILGYTNVENFKYLKRHNLIQAIFSLDYAKEMQAYAKEHNITLKGHIKLDTGMSRIGIVCQEKDYRIDEVLEIYQMPNIQVDGVFSHFSVSDNLDDESVQYTLNQVKAYDRVIDDIKAHGYKVGTTHIQNSYGILNYGYLKYDYVRPGLLYMGVTSDDSIEIKTNPNFLPVLSLKARVSLVKTIQKDVTISYGRNYTSKQESKIATVSIGYADGYPRTLSNKNARVLIHGQYANIVGNICMDQLMIDVSHIENVKEGDIVTFIGEDGDKKITVDEISRLANTINNETFTRFTYRLPRIFNSQ